MKAKTHRKPAHIERVTAYVTMSDKRKLVFLDISLDTLNVMGQFYAKADLTPNAVYGSGAITGGLFNDETRQKKPLPRQVTSTGKSKSKATQGEDTK